MLCLLWVPTSSYAADFIFCWRRPNKGFSKQYNFYMGSVAFLLCIECSMHGAIAARLAASSTDRGVKHGVYLQDPRG